MAGTAGSAIGAPWGRRLVLAAALCLLIAECLVLGALSGWAMAEHLERALAELRDGLPRYDVRQWCQRRGRWARLPSWLPRSAPLPAVALLSRPLCPERGWWMTVEGNRMQTHDPLRRQHRRPGARRGAAVTCRLACARRRPAAAGIARREHHPQGDGVSTVTGSGSPTGTATVVRSPSASWAGIPLGLVRRATGSRSVESRSSRSRSAPGSSAADRPPCARVLRNPSGLNFRSVQAQDVRSEQQPARRGA